MNAPAPIVAPPVSGAQNLREVRRGVAEAPDAQVLQVLRMVDALEVRGTSDEVLAPVRPRLRAMQPARPLRFARLMFMPADTLIVAPLAWHAGTPFMPRNALMVLSHAIRSLMLAPDAPPGAAECLARTDALIAGVTTAQTAVVRQAGTMLWPRAAILLARLGADPSPACRAEWAAESLPAAELAPLALSLSGILAAAVALHDHDHAGISLKDASLAAMLAGAEKLGPRAWGMMLSLLMIRVPESSTALLAAAQANRMQRALADAATETALAWLETETANQVAVIPPNAAAELNRQATLLQALADQTERAPADTRRRVAQARATLLAGSLQRFETSLQDRLAAPLQTLPAAPEARDAALDAMEATARSLRAFDLEARRLGGGAKLDALVARIGQAVHGAPGLLPMDRARLMEILAGPEAASKVLAEPSR